jgi:streptogramin lyase
MVFRHELESGHCTAYLMLPGEGGVHGLQWRPDGGPSGSVWAARPGAQRIDHVDAASGELLGSLPFPLPRAHGLFWDETGGRGSLQVVETNGGRVFRLEPGTGQVLDEWRVEGGEAHGFTRSADGRIWLGDAETNTVLVIEP